MDWGKFDKKVDVEALQKDVKAAKENDFGDRPEIPDGEYEVMITKMELKESSKKDPMLSIWFKIMAGEFKGNLIFYNGVMQPDSQWIGMQIHNNNVMLRNVWDAEDDEVKFDGFEDYNELILDIAEEVVEQDNWHYQLKQTTNKKNSDFKDLEIVEVLD
ncbi:DUF669 domain-containing protein [Pediococcus pentosaceus]|uniref:DUF669 domain-containing protein n=1 Tax=Pediococcus pentosaceus TaxID=1255 RepID=UPI00132FAD94|nr:DUF669 domain-containing protein [Pediococcus pentosaceus]KAF0422140.1 DUF669 domain-containing protein [Pediococcus pentosaceus]QYY85564.1 DUF669 domain-containing protein [Pediococcus pentosaceus]